MFTYWLGFCINYGNKQNWVAGIIMFMRNQMLMRKQKLAEEKLVLGDYVTVNKSAVKESQIDNGASHDVLVQFENLFQRIVKQRGELHVVQQRTDSVINVGHRRRKALQNSAPQNSELQNSA